MNYVKKQASGAQFVDVQLLTITTSLNGVRRPISMWNIWLYFALVTIESTVNYLEKKHT